MFGSTLQAAILVRVCLEAQYKNKHKKHIQFQDAKKEVFPMKKLRVVMCT